MFKNDFMESYTTFWMVEKQLRGRKSSSYHFIVKSIIVNKSEKEGYTCMLNTKCICSLGMYAAIFSPNEYLIVYLKIPIFSSLLQSMTSLEQSCTIHYLKKTL